MRLIPKGCAALLAALTVTSVGCAPMVNRTQFYDRNGVVHGREHAKTPGLFDLVFGVSDAKGPPEHYAPVPRLTPMPAPVSNEPMGSPTGNGGVSSNAYQRTYMSQSNATYRYPAPVVVNVGCARKNVPCKHGANIACSNCLPEGTICDPRSETPPDGGN